MHKERRWRKLREEGAETLKGAPTGAMVGLAGPTWQPPDPRCFGLLPESSHDVSRGG